MKYPRINEKLDRRKKIHSNDKIEIINLYKNGMVINNIAKKFSVSWFTIKYVIDENYRNEVKIKNKKYACNRYKCDKNYVEKHREYSKESCRYTRQINKDEFKKYRHYIYIKRKYAK